MSRNDDDDDLYDAEDDGGESRRNPLRGTVNKLEKRLKDLEKQLTERDDELGVVKKANRQRTVADVLKDKGADPRLAKYALRDMAEDEVNAEAVEKWLATEGDLFGYKPAPPAQDPAQVLGLPVGTELPPDLVEAYQRWQSSQSGGTTPAGGGDQALMAKIQDPDLTREQLEALILSS